MPLTIKDDDWPDFCATGGVRFLINVPSGWRLWFSVRLISNADNKKKMEPDSSLFDNDFFADSLTVRSLMAELPACLSARLSVCLALYLVSVCP